MRLLSTLLAGTTVIVAAPAVAQVRPLVDPPASAEAARDGVYIFLLNEGAASAPATGPAEIETIARDGTRLRLIAAPGGEASIAPGGFARVHYRLAVAAPPVVEVTAAPLAPSPPAKAEDTAATSRGAAAGFLDRLHPYAPIYGVAGLNDAGAKLQVSFDFRLLGHDDGPRLDFAYTQTIFWAIDRPSGPIRTADYSPELFVDVPLGAHTLIGGGYRHDSNGGGPATSIDVNRLYLRATHSFDLGNGWGFDITPQAWGYFGDQGLAPDLDRYWGYTSLGLALGQRDGIRLALTGRGNPGTGKGAVEGFLSYPLARISASLPHLYLFAQGFAGYGESLSDYSRRATRARLGMALIR